MPIEKDLNCAKEINKLSDIVEDNKVPYHRQIMKYNENKNFDEVINLAIQDLNGDFFI